MLQRWLLRIDLWTAWVFVWLFGLERRGLTTDDHRFFADRYQRLADLHRNRGHITRAARLEAKAREHVVAQRDPDEPPYAAAMAMPRPRPYVRTDAVSRTHLQPPDDAA
jgi:hypothetical protein